MDLITKQIALLLLLHIQGSSLQGLSDSISTPSVRYGDTAKIACDFAGSNKDIQYVTWTKLITTGFRLPVHSYVTCSGENSGYNTLKGRSIMEIEKERHTDLVNVLVNSDLSSREAFVSSFEPASDAVVYSYLSDRRRPLREGYSRIRLLIQNVQLTDDGLYECTVKLRQMPPMSTQTRLHVVVPPSAINLSSSQTEIVMASNLTLTCSANTGLPRGVITWAKRKPNEKDFVDIPQDSVSTNDTLLANGTVFTVSTLNLELHDFDDQTLVRCQASNPVLGSWDKKPEATFLVNVLFPPKDGKILFDASRGKYYCEARAHPSPSYVWLRLGDVREEDDGIDENRDGSWDGKKIIMSTNRFLDLSSIVGEGYFRFRCLASNVINGTRHTKVMDTKLRVLGRPVEPKTTSPAPIQPAISDPRHATNWVTAQGPPLSMLRHNVLIQPVLAANRVSTNLSNANSRDAVEDIAIGVPPTSAPPTVSSLLKTSTINSQGSAKEGSPLTKTLPPQTKSLGRSGGGGGSRGGGRGGGGGGGGDYEVFEDMFIVQSPIQMARLLSRVMARNAPDSGKMEPLLSLTLRNGTRIPVNISAPEYKHIRNVFYRRLMELAKRRKQEALRRNRNKKRSHDKSSEGRLVVGTPNRINSQLPLIGTITKILPDGYNDVIQEKDKLIEYGNTFGRGEYPDEKRHKSGADISEYDYGDVQNEADMEEFTEYSPSSYRLSMNPFAKNLRTTYDEPLETNETDKAQTYQVNDSNEKVSKGTWREFDCRQKSDGVFGGGCRAFYRCISGDTYLVQCKPQYVYNRKSGKCTPRMKAPAPCGIWRDCSKLENGKYADIVRGCKYYFTCQSGLFFGHNKCNEGLLFNEELQVCDWPHEIPPPCGQKTT